MKKKIFISILIIMQACFIFAQENNILEKIDSYRLYSNEGFSFDYEIIEAKDTYKMKVFVKSGDADSILTIYREPVDLSGRKILVLDNSFWLQDNRMKSAVKISAQQMLVGQASAGDITNIVFSKLYNIIQSEVKDNIKILNLESKSKKGGNYQKIVLYIEEKTSVPLKAFLYSKNGLHIKTIEYSPLEIINGKPMITSFKIINELNTQVSNIQIKNFSKETLPDRYYTREGMQNLK